ncbi:peptidylprolyl isomerase [Agrobacterium sp. a22-2]|uniref:SurA N-terminal domain-containing protein n=1 Tax=Agrobacterium sp. a22-2 TaxID=2283840 RepID=UPI001446C021|nr:SurA N-terminal domain-containing protein [Agrobacterium sp. a22-2]NKN38007.1 peptidylprolyl isomerase [Agrobacterium sp. a22-2]
MIMGRKAIRTLALGTAMLALFAFIEPGAAPVFAASEIKAVVNKTAITSGDIAKRAAFMRLRRQKGDIGKLAKEEMVDEVLKRQEIARLGMSVSTADVDKAFERFAASNKLSAAQMTSILNQSGVGAEHFKAYLAVQMSWPRLVNARYGAKSKLSNQDIVTRLLENKQKPVTTEYFLKQVIFVVPESKRNAITGKRKSEAEASRSKFPGCDGAMEFAKNYLDVSIRNLGRVMAPELPPEWKPLIEKASGGTTGTRVTEKGVEYLAICNQREVSDDVAAEVVFRAEDVGKAENQDDPNSKKFLDELRSKAQIVYR